MSKLIFVFTFAAATLYSLLSQANTACLNGSAAGYACQNVNLAGKIQLANSGFWTPPIASQPGQPVGSYGSGVWGWTDKTDNREYALMGLNNKVAIVDITQADKPVHVADMPTQTVASMWREVSVYDDYAVVVSEAMGHGLQILDLKQLRTLSRDKVHILRPSAHYPHFGSAHTVFAHSETGYVYALGSDTCDAGAHVVDMRNPLQPKFSTCLDRAVFEGRTKKRFSLVAFGGEEHQDAVYTHDMVCIIYRGPDKDYDGHEICVASNDSTLNIVDVTDKSSPYLIAVTSHPNRGFIHQGWFTEDHRFFAVNDEFDEMLNDQTMTTYFYDFSDLDKPVYKQAFDHGVANIDHNHYVKGNYLYQANYLMGLTILDISQLANGEVKVAGQFDTTPNEEGADFGGIWNIYPFFKSGNIIMSGIDDGVLYIVYPELGGKSNAKSLSIKEPEELKTIGDSESVNR